MVKVEGTARVCLGIELLGQKSGPAREVENSRKVSAIQIDGCLARASYSRVVDPI